MRVRRVRRFVSSFSFPSRSSPCIFVAYSRHPFFSLCFPGSTLLSSSVPRSVSPRFFPSSLPSMYRFRTLVSLVSTSRHHLVLFIKPLKSTVTVIPFQILSLYTWFCLHIFLRALAPCSPFSLPWVPLSLLFTHLSVLGFLMYILSLLEGYSLTSTSSHL